MNCIYISIFILSIIKVTKLSSSSNVDIEDFDSSYYDGRDGKQGDVYIYVREVQGTIFIYHHFIVFKEENQRGGIIYEWGNNGSSFYPTNKIKGTECLKLGFFKQKDVYLAALEASNKKNYEVHNYNCNKWTEFVALKLGVKVDVSQLFGRKKLSQEL